MSLRRRTALNAVLLLVARTLSRLVVLVSVIVAQNGLGGERYGEFSTAIVFSAISSIAADLGLQVVFTREASRRREDIGDLLAATLGAKLPLSAVSGLVLAGGMALLAPSLLHLVPEVFVLLVVTSVATLLRSCFYATGEMRWEVIAISAETAVLVGVTVAAFRAHAGVGAYIDAYTASYLVTLVFAATVVQRRYARLRVAWDPGRLRVLLRSGLPFALGFVLTTIYFRIDVVILQALRGFTQVGWYNAAYKFLDGLSFVPQAVMNAVYPALSVMAAQGAAPMRRAYARAYRLLAVLGVPTTVGVALLASPIVRVTHTLPEAAPSLRVLAFSLVFIFVVNTFVFALGAMDRQLTFALLTGASVVVNVALNLVMIPLFPHGDGYLAASWATVATEVLLCVAGLFALSRHLGAVPWASTALPAVVSGLVMAGATFPVRDRSLWLSIPVATVSYVIAAFATRAVTREDVADVVAAARGR